MDVVEEVALQLDLGHTPTEGSPRLSAAMDGDREQILDALCRKSLTSRSEPDVYLGFERGQITKDDPNFERAKAIDMRENPESGNASSQARNRPLE